MQLLKYGLVSLWTSRASLRADAASSSQYDHITFTGVVPRSFIGALTVATATYPFKLFMDFTGLYNPLALQITREIDTFSAFAQES